jgi:Rhodopirellula transposase DDE domain
VPYGVYDVAANEGWVSVGITADTAEFAVAAIRTWLARMGHGRYPELRELTITADCGGSNGARVRLWKRELQIFADETGLVLHVHSVQSRRIAAAGVMSTITITSVACGPG